ncbi:SIR2 family protein [Clostridium tyrobutyricum]|uniref:SIR2 family protein n=1 Tax=Clostridium tyrobutyricum TaxID=1519 RepID=UPI001C37FE64|nr:SIR2 family protein [Clostridium tyrobutyricum]MBV4429616.1 SIR2 family protein [Clostridium tyrobutyricum]MBV4444838.1 SIR2 family protein [Clostridium tyrobutyricum]
MNESIRKLKEAADNNKLVVFVGAGVSANSGLPDWKELIEEYRDALEMDKSKPISSDEYLKIPQYYYNMRGFKDYYDIINKVFNKNYNPNKIHELIFRLAPQHIITTNYDNLIEQEKEKQGLLYDVVCEDKDLPYTPNGKLIIKMHGDLKRKNIVLKEEDYLSYEENFRLIETFIKSLFVNHTVVFIGYSLGDYDLKLIINNVKSILGKHFQKGYIINSSDQGKRIFILE